MFIYRKNSKVNLRKEFFVMIFEDCVVPDFQIRKMKNWHLEQFQSAKELMVWNYCSTLKPRYNEHFLFTISNIS